MERVLDVYKRPYNPLRPVVCMDETPRQLIAETRAPMPMVPGRAECHDYEYERRGTYNIFMASEPLAGRRMIEVTERKTRQDWARFMAQVATAYPDAERITLVLDNLNTHCIGAFYDTFDPAEAKALVGRFEFIHTPKHGSWLNMAEIELNVMIAQCLRRHIPSLEIANRELAAWKRDRDKMRATINWQFTAENARVKLKRLYPTLEG